MSNQRKIKNDKKIFKLRYTRMTVGPIESQWTWSIGSNVSWRKNTRAATHIKERKLNRIQSKLLISLTIWLKLGRWWWSNHFFYHDDDVWNRPEALAIVDIECASWKHVHKSRRMKWLKLKRIQEPILPKKGPKANRIEMRSENNMVKLIAERCTISYIVTSSAMCTLIKLQMRKAMKQ